VQPSGSAGGTTEAGPLACRPERRPARPAALHPPRRSARPSAPPPSDPPQEMDARCQEQDARRIKLEAWAADLARREAELHASAKVGRSANRPGGGLG
jgi:hypothetical protein